MNAVPRASSSDAAHLSREVSATLALAAPLILSNISQILIGMTDVVLLGHLGAEALAASAIGTGLVWALTLFGIGLVTASSPLIASAIGRRHNVVRDVRRTVRQTMWCALTISAPILILLWFTSPLLRWVGQPERLASDAGTFVRAMEWVVPSALITITLKNFVAALERPIWSLVISVCGVFANALINWSLIFGHLGAPPLGLFGAGLGSSLVNLLMLGAMVLLVTQHVTFRRFHVFGHFWRADWPRYRALWMLGAPIGLQMGFEATVFAAAVVLMGYIGTVAVAAHAIAIQIASMTFMVPLGIAQAATVRVGTALGRGDPSAIARAGHAALALGLGFMASMALIIWTIPQTLAALFIDPHVHGNAQVLMLAVSFLKVAAVFQIADGAQVVGAGMLRGLHDTKMPMLFAAIGYWGVGIGVGAFLAFRLGLGGVGIWLGLALGLAIVGVCMNARWLLRERLGLA